MVGWDGFVGFVLKVVSLWCFCYLFVVAGGDFAYLMFAWMSHSVVWRWCVVFFKCLCYSFLNLCCFWVVMCLGRCYVYLVLVICKCVCYT